MVFPFSNCTSFSSAGKSDKRDKGHKEEKFKKKLLLNKRLYLDIKNHSVASKLETNLKALGAVIEVFLVREVNYVVTDRADKIESGFSPLLESPQTDSPTELQEKKLTTKSRAEAMLERARQLPQQNVRDPLDNAIRWGIPIWPLEKVLKWLHKLSVLTKKNTSVKVKGSKSRLLKEPYIKIETLDRKYQPVYKEFDIPVVLDIDNPLFGSPFAQRKNTSVASNIKVKTKNVENKKVATLSDDSRMTHKKNSEQQVKVHNTTVQVTSYCEICQVNYVNQQEHTASEKHKSFVKNDENFMSLDLLISDHSDVGNFLKMNGISDFNPCSMPGSSQLKRSLRSCHSLDTDVPSTSTSMRQTFDEKQFAKAVGQQSPLEVHCNGLANRGYDTRFAARLPISVRHGSVDFNTRRRVRTSSVTDYGATHEPVLLSPTGSDSGHQLRCRDHIWLPKSLLGTTAEDDNILSRTKPPSSSPSTEVSNSHFSKSPQEVKSDEGPIKLKIKQYKKGNEKSFNCFKVIRRKRPSAEEKLIEDNRAYYKIELKSSKLRSSRYYLAQRENENTESGTESSTTDSLERPYSDKASSICDSESVKKMPCTVNNDKFNSEKISYIIKSNFERISNINGKLAQKSPSLIENKSNSEKMLRSSVERSLDVSIRPRPKKGPCNYNKFNSEKLFSPAKVNSEKSNSIGSVSTGRTENFRSDNKFNFEKPQCLNRKPKMVTESSVKERKSENKKPSSVVVKKPKHDASNLLGKEKKRDHVSPKKIYRRRVSEISILTREAETFMFGESAILESPTNIDTKIDEISTAQTSHADSSDDESEVECKVKPKDKKETSPVVIQRKQIKKKPKSNTCEEKSAISAGHGNRVKNQKEKKKRRRTHAELFIHDNLDYYKFEISDSRLRHNSVTSTDKAGKNEASGERPYATRSSVVRDDSSESDDKPLSTILHCVSIKSNSKNESNKEDKNEPNEDDDDQADCMGIKKEEEQVDILSSVLLNKMKFSFEYLPSSEPWYKTYKRQDKGKQYKFVTYEPKVWKTFKLPYEMPKKNPVISNLLPRKPVVQPNRSGKLIKHMKKKRRRRFHQFLSSKPRKSPRCHASTLAILSGVVSRRQKHLGKAVSTLVTNSENVPILGASSNHQSISNSEPSVKSSSDLLDGIPVVEDMPESLEGILNVADEEINSIRLDGVNLVHNEDNSPSANGSSSKFNFSQRGRHANNKASNKGKVGARKKNKTGVVAETFNNVPPTRTDFNSEADVLNLLDTFSRCQCKEGISCTRFPHTDLISCCSSAVETSCNTSDFSTSSVCDFSVFPNTSKRKFNSGVRKRKRKINLTGWPVEKRKKKGKDLDDDKKKLSPLKRLTHIADDENSSVSSSIDNVALSEIIAVSQKSESGNTNNVKPVETKVKNAVPLSENKAKRFVKPSGVKLDFMPCVRVRRLTNIANIVTRSQQTGFNNAMRLRSASCSSLNLIEDDNASVASEDPNLLYKRPLARKAPKVDTRWESWSVIGKRR